MKTQHETSPRSSLRRFLTLCELNDLESTTQACLDGRLTRNHYRDDQGNGCLVHFATGGTVVSRATLRERFPSEEEYALAHAVITAWDAMILTLEVVQEELARAIAERKEVNAQEQQTIRAVRSRLKQRSGASGEVALV
jgi:hypothetical protein